MNYLKEINSFYDWLETNSISNSAIVLWHALMHINNRAGWIPEFAVAISTLEVKTGLKKDAILTARNRLQQMGRIKIKTRPGQQSALYSIIPFDSENPTQTASQINCSGKTDTNRHTNPRAKSTQTATIIKLNNSHYINSKNESKPEPQLKSGDHNGEYRKNSKSASFSEYPTGGIG